jgi:hypothetical protein
VSSSTVRARARKRRRVLAVVITVLAIAASGVYWLDTSGVVTAGLVPLPTGVANLGGKLATVTPLSSASIAFPQSPSQVSGYAIARITIPQGLATATPVYFSWTDPQDANNPLNYCSVNNNAGSCAGWLEFAVYYPVQKAACTTNDTNTGGAPVATIADNYNGSGNVTYCLRQDTSATGKLVGTSSPLSGQVLVSKQMLGSFLQPGVTDPSSTSCPTSAPGSATTLAWCTPSVATASTNVFYIVVSVILPGYNVPGSATQQSPATSLKFWVTVH